MSQRSEPIAASSYMFSLARYINTLNCTNTLTLGYLIKQTHDIHYVRLFKPTYPFENATKFKSYSSGALYCLQKQLIHSNLPDISQPLFVQYLPKYFAAKLQFFTTQ